MCVKQIYQLLHFEVSNSVRNTELMEGLTTFDSALRDDNFDVWCTYSHSFKETYNSVPCPKSTSTQTCPKPDKSSPKVTSDS